VALDHVRGDVTGPSALELERAAEALDHAPAASLRDAARIVRRGCCVFLMQGQSDRHLA
jgi:hypothetical protein